MRPLAQAVRATALMAACMLALAGIADAAKPTKSPVKTPKSHAFSGTFVVTTVTSWKAAPGPGGLPAAPGSMVSNAGTVRSGAFGSGKLTATSTFDWSPAPGSMVLHGRGRFAFKHATLTFTYKLMVTVQADDRVFSAAAATVVGGRGRLRHAKGTFSFAGSSLNLGSPATFTFHGTLKY